MARRAKRQRRTADEVRVHNVGKANVVQALQDVVKSLQNISINITLSERNAMQINRLEEKKRNLLGRRAQVILKGWRVGDDGLILLLLRIQDAQIRS